MNFRDKIISWEDLPAWRAAFRARGLKLAVTNGCFDLLHLGHVTYLESARKLADALLIGVNSDDAVRQLKGRERPINPEADRAAVLAALQSVDGVCVFAEKTATRFLTLVQPDIYVKGGDYTLETLNQEERASGGARRRKDSCRPHCARQIYYRDLAADRPALIPLVVQRLFDFQMDFRRFIAAIHCGIRKRRQLATAYSCPVAEGIFLRGVALLINIQLAVSVLVLDDTDYVFAFRQAVVNPLIRGRFDDKTIGATRQWLFAASTVPRCS